MEKKIRDGIKEFESLKIDIEGIFHKIDGLINYDNYQNAFQQIIEEVNQNSKQLFRKMYSPNMTLDYETYIYSPSIRKLQELKKEMERELLPYYELYLLNKKMKESLLDVKEDNINDLIRDGKLLLQKINSLNTHNRNDFNQLIEESYQIIYLSLLHEETLDRDDLICYINYLSIQEIKEKLGKFLRKDLDQVKESVLIEEELENLPLEGLGYDYLNSKILRIVAKKVLKEEEKSYRLRKEEAISNLRNQFNDFIREKDSKESFINQKKTNIRKLRIQKAFSSSKALSYVLIPAVSFSLGNMIGHVLSNRITEYKTTTKTIDLKTEEIVGDIEEIYDEEQTVYATTVKECSPWRRNKSGGYIRDVIAYSYENLENDSYEEIENVLEESRNYSLTNKVMEKYRYTESTQELKENDSLTEKTILLTETYQDKKDNRKSRKYIVPLSITGFGLGIVIDILLACFTSLRLSYVKEEFKRLDKKIKREKLEKEKVEKLLVDIYQGLSNIKDDYNEIVKKYGKMEQEIDFNNIKKLTR